jgi:LmbE family N-acetylglucosaminyl deacetylase
MKILSCFAHPDDETILSGGLLALLSETGNEIHFLCCTKGEGGECGEPPVCIQNELGKVREKELSCAVDALGGSSLNFLDYQDPLVGADNKLYSFTEDVDELTSKIEEFVEKYQIDIIISHGSNGEYGHPGHLTVFQAVRKLVNNYPEKLYWYTVQAFYENSSKPHILNKDDPSDWVIDISSVVDKKILAAYCHESQHALFVRKKTKELNRPIKIEEVIVDQESYHLAFGDEDILMKNPKIIANIQFSKE